MVSPRFAAGAFLLGALGWASVEQGLAASPPAKWQSVSGVNVCDGTCGCQDGQCKDSKKFKFHGVVASSDACANTCETDATGVCDIWIYSAGSKHCWWRADHEWHIEGTQADVTSGCRSTVANCGTNPHPNPKPKPTPAPGPPTPPPPPPGPFVPTQAGNMNGDYELSCTPNGKDCMDKFPVHYKDYPGGVEYFDVYAPMISTLYSQVFWTGLPAVDLPQDIVDRYHGKGMAVVGFEVDQVRRTPEGDMQVPINFAYNHHFESNMVGAKSSLEKIKFTGASDPRRLAIMKERGMGHEITKDTHYVVHDNAPGNPIPTSQSFTAGNGGEYRKTFHGYAPGFAQVIESPQKFQFTPMQIDTWNRDKMDLNANGTGKFYPGPEPRNSLAPPQGVDALYSGLLECPVSTRLTKVMDMGYLAKMDGTCANVITTADECFSAAVNTLGGSSTAFTSDHGTDPTKPAGCSATADIEDSSIIHVYFNTGTSQATCGAGSASVTRGATQSLVHVDMVIDTKAGNVTIKLAGPAGVWFGVGMNASAMKDSPWAIIVDGEGQVTERKLQDQNPGAQLAQSVHVLSSSVDGAFRNVTLTRSLKGMTSDYYTFDPTTAAKLNFINAVGSGPMLAYHKNKLPSSISILPVGKSAGACICGTKPLAFGQAKGKLLYTRTNQSADQGQGEIGCCNSCQPQPRSDMLWQKNPTCDIRSYTGGQIACHHLFSLLDKDQEIPWEDKPLQYQHKFRFWVQPYNASYHQNVNHVTWGIASPVEYDVPKCGPEVKGCKQSADGNWEHTIRGTWSGNGKLVAAHFHCHAPTCLSVQMYRCNKTVAVCNETTGELICREDPIYGLKGKIDKAGFDEPGFIAVPPCLWGSPEQGLEPPVDVAGYTLHSYKTANATYGHHGEMAWQQMYLV